MMRNKPTLRFEFYPQPWASADFFPEGGKKNSGGGARTYYLPKKTTKNILFFSNSIKTN
jgi:hypothetical protein